MPEEFQFTRQFQNSILACAMRHPEEFMDYMNIIEPSYFSHTIQMSTCKCIKKFFAKQSKIPAWDTLVQLVADDLAKNDTLGDGLKYVKGLRKIDTSDWEYVAERVVQFCRYAGVLRLIQGSGEKYFKKGELPDAAFIGSLEEALRIGDNLEDIGVMLNTDGDKILDKITKTDYGVSTGYAQFDAIWKRGWGPGWLIVPLAPPKRYKTSFALNLALNMAGETVGADVIYYTCEISEELGALRAYVNIAGQNQDYLYNSPEKFRAAMHEGIDLKLRGKFFMKGFPSKSVKISDIKAHAKMIIKQFNLKPKAIFIDYAETIVGANPKESAHEQSANVYTDARAMGRELGCCIIMPDRCTREAVQLAVPNMESFQGAFQKAGVVDVAIGLCATDEEIQSGILRTFVFLNRHGPALQHFTGKVDADLMKIEIGEEIPYEPDSAERPANGGRRKKNEAPAQLILDDEA